MKYTTWIILIAIVVIAAITNPDKAMHREAVKDEVKELVRDEIGDSDIESFFGKIIVGALLDTFVEQAITVDNYLVFSLSKMRIDNKDKVIGIGLFGHVFVSFNRDDLLEDLKNYDLSIQ